MKAVAIFGLIGAIGLAVPAFAVPVERTADIGLTFNQTSYSDSWTGGDTGALAWTLASNFALDESLSVKVPQKNTLKLSYGQTHTQNEGEDGRLHWQKPKKSSDRMFAESLLRLTLGEFVDPFAALTFESQFQDVSVPVVPRYVNPMLISEAVGVGRSIARDRPRPALLPTRVRAARERPSGHPERRAPAHQTNTETDGGLDWTTDFNRKFAGEQMKVVSKLRVFKALFNSKADEWKGLPNQDDWKAVDLAWENTFSAGIGKYIQVQLFTELLYDKEIDRRGRLREVLGLGVSYKLF